MLLPGHGGVVCGVGHKIFPSALGLGEQACFNVLIMPGW